MDEASAGRLIADKYRVMRALGHGSTGTVFLCEHTALEKEVAVKVLHRELTDNSGLVQRFQREARTAARLDHPNTVHVMDFGQDDDGTLYLAMEYVEGRDLAEVLEAEWPLSDQRIVDVMSQVLSALSAAHAIGIVHRDLKPENILVRAATEAQDEQIKVCDFGIAQLSPIRLSKPGRPESPMPMRVTGDGMVVGTPAYMSPEQARGLQLDARSDLYSAGVVLFQLLTRTLPFVSETPMSVAVMHCTTPPPPPSGFGRVNPALEAVCLRAMSKTQDARYQTAGEMLGALQDAIARPSNSRALARRSLAPITGNGSMALVRMAPPALPARSSRPARLGSPVSGIAAAPTELCVPAVHGHARVFANPRRRRRTSLLLAAVATSLLALVSVPRLLPAKHEPTVVQNASTQAQREPIASAPAPSAMIPLASAPASAPESRERESMIPLATPAPTTEPRAVTLLASAAPTANAHSHGVRLRKPASATPEAPVTATDAPSEVLPSEATGAVLSVLGESMNRDSAPLMAAKVVEEKPTPSLEMSEFMAPAPAEKPVAPVIEAPQPTAAAPAPAPVAPTTSFAPSHARVAIGSTQSRGVAKADVRAALNQAAFTRCYRDARQAGAGPTEGVSGTLELSTDMSGRITSARLASDLPKPLRDCIEQAARLGQVRGVDTGKASATIELQFQP